MFRDFFEGARTALGGSAILLCCTQLEPSALDTRPIDSNSFTIVTFISNINVG